MGIRPGHGKAELTALHEAIETQTTALGYDPAEHQFTPHVTIARMDNASGKSSVQHRVRNNDPDVGQGHITRIKLIESVLRNTGPEYSTLDTIRL